MNRMPGVPGGGVVTEKGEFERAKSLRGIQLVELRLQGRGRDGLGDEAVEEAPAERRVDLRLVGVRGTSNNHGPLPFRGRLPGPIFARARHAVHDGHEEVHDADII